MKEPTKEYGGELPHETMSVCPVCNKVIPALVYEEDGKVWEKKTCPEHGEFKEIYYEDVEVYNKFRKLAYTWGKLESFNTPAEKECPWSCGLCPMHLSHTNLLNIVLTNRCDLSCWYCFFYAKKGMPIYEPSIEQIREMLELGKKERPVSCNAVQFTGGEPTMRDDLPEIIRLAKELGYEHVQLNTNGIRISKDINLLEEVVKNGVNVLYLSFDGITPKTNIKNHWETPFVLENVRKVGNVGIVLVPTVIKNTNLHEVGEILKFGLNNIDVVRGVNFQPVSLVGSMPKEERKKYRVTIPGVMKALEEQTNGAVSVKDWYPIPTAGIIGEFIYRLTNNQYWMTSHFACGAATYVFLGKNDEVMPITKIVDVDGFIEFIREKSAELEKGRSPAIVKAKLMVNLPRFVDIGEMKKLGGLDLAKLIYNAFVKADYSALGEFHKRTLFIGMMHFQDPFNYDVERVRRCVIHYATPDGRVIPFCTFNVFPDVYRDAIQEKFSIPWEEWMKTHPGYDMAKEKYVRSKEDIAKMESSEVYKKAYNGKDFW